MLRITKFTDYGFLMLAHMANSHEPLHNARDLSGACHIPLPMASKILKMLAREGVLVSHRGIKGGYSLSRSPERITVADIVGALEGPIALTECLDETTTQCALEFHCPLKTNWDRINQVIKEALTKITLKEMAQTFAAPCKSAAVRPEGQEGGNEPAAACGCSSHNPTL